MSILKKSLAQNLIDLYVSREKPLPRKSKLLYRVINKLNLNLHEAQKYFERKLFFVEKK